jgi:hypothetical protein
MGFLSNLFMAVLGAINPIIGLCGSFVRYVTDDSEHAGSSLMLDIVSGLLPGGFIKDLAVGTFADAFFEANSIEEATNNVVQYNDIIMKCDNCDEYSHYYAKFDNEIRCKNCLDIKLDRITNSRSKIYLRKEKIIELDNYYRKYSISVKEPQGLKISTSGRLRVKGSSSFRIHD